MKRYGIKSEPLPDMRLFLETYGDQDLWFEIKIDDVNKRVQKIDDLIEQLKVFRKECWKFIDREKNKAITAPLYAEIDRLQAIVDKGEKE